MWDHDHYETRYIIRIGFVPTTKVDQDTLMDNGEQGAKSNSIKMNSLQTILAIKGQGQNRDAWEGLHLF